MLSAAQSIDDTDDMVVLEEPSIGALRTRSQGYPDGLVDDSLKFAPSQSQVSHSRHHHSKGSR